MTNLDARLAAELENIAKTKRAIDNNEGSFAGCDFRTVAESQVKYFAIKECAAKGYAKDKWAALGQLWANA
jgi:hypothetical protein